MQQEALAVSDEAPAVAADADEVHRQQAALWPVVLPVQSAENSVPVQQMLLRAKTAAVLSAVWAVWLMTLQLRKVESLQMMLSALLQRVIFLIRV